MEKKLLRIQEVIRDRLLRIEELDALSATRSPYRCAFLQAAVTLQSEVRFLQDKLKTLEVEHVQ